MRVIIPGASGFIGKNFILKAPRNWEIIAIYNKSSLRNFVEAHRLDNVITVKCDLTNEKEVEKLSKQVGDNFDACLYLAANTLIPVSVKEPLSDLFSNTAGLINFFEHFHGGKVIYNNSGTVYQGLTGMVSPESYVSPKIPYGISKLASENYIKFYQSRRKSFEEYVIIRFFGAYGSYEPSHKIYTKLVKNFCFENKNTFTMYGNGKNYIDAMYIDDAIDALLKIIKSDKGNVTADLCYGEPLTINELVKNVAYVFGNENITIQHEGESEEYITFYASPQRMEQLFDFKPRIKLKDGMKMLAKHLEREKDG